jgi:formate hydrogenlyase subunit 3/multisubunit Na+/H+ antiporter MnhD subunit
MSSNLTLWLLAMPAVFAVVAPLLAMPLAPRLRGATALFPLAHLANLALAALALQAPPTTMALGFHDAPASAHILLAIDRPRGAQLVLAGILFLILATFSHGFVRDTRLGPAFLMLLLWAQTAVNLVVLAGDFFALYLGLLLLSLSLILMIGLDFNASGGAAALRVFATLEVPSAVALTSLWVIDARAGTTALTDLAQNAPWLGQPESLTLSVPIGVALLSRAGLFPFQKWVAVGCRAAAGPVAAVVTGIAVPIGALVLARFVSAFPFDPTWLTALEAIAAATALIAAVAALRERTGRGWLAYAAVAQVALAVVGFAAGDPVSSATGWLALASAAASMLLLGLGLATALRVTGSDERPRLDGISLRPQLAIAIALGYLAIAAVPPFGSFSGRQILVDSLLRRGSTVDLISALAVLLATAGLGAAIWRPLLGARPANLAASGRQTKTASESRGAANRASRRSRSANEAVPVLPRSEQVSPANAPLGIAVQGALGASAILMILTGVAPVGWLATLVGVSWPSSVQSTNGVAAALVGVAVLAGLGWPQLAERLSALSNAWGDRLRPVARLDKRFELSRAIDPYLVVGGILLLLGRLSAAIIDNTLGRLVRAS